MSDPGILLDLSLCIALLLLGWRLLHSSDHFQAAVLFITFGLVLSLTWVRLEAPDIAIAEAAVGAGLAGVMLVDALRKIKTSSHSQVTGDWQQVAKLPLFHKLTSLAVVLALISLLLMTVWTLPRTGKGLAGLVNSTLAASGTEHPVTAVLLNFRGYDTWLELGILLLAVFGVLCIRRSSGLDSVALPPATNPILENMVMLITPFILLVSGYLLWRGAFAPGGAFQAGVVLGAGSIFLWMAGYPSLTILPDKVWRSLIILGFFAFLVFGCFSLVVTGVFLAYDSVHGAVQILLLETAASVSIGAGLAGLMLALQPLHKTKLSAEELGGAAKNRRSSNKGGCET
jgi:multisubunit Na+/H+ antiporter MnhB subunit